MNAEKPVTGIVPARGHQAGDADASSAQRFFLAGNGLPGRWASRERFVVLETGFGSGADFLASWAAWRDDPLRCQRLVYIAIDPCPHRPEVLAEDRIDAPERDLARQLAAVWPPMTPNIHRLTFEKTRVELLLVVDEVVPALRALVADIDAFFLHATGDGQSSPDWLSISKGMARLAAEQATAASTSKDKQLLAGLRSAGFKPTEVAATSFRAAGTAMQFAPRFVASRPPARRGASVAGTAQRAIVLGAGLAGCASVAALAEQGWSCVLVDRQTTPAAEASGNLAGLFHGVVHAHDGHHARFNRAASLEAARVYRQLIAATPSGALRLGEVSGLLRLGSGLPDTAAMQELLARLGLPPAYVEAVDQAGASRLAGLPIATAAWFFPQGGWMRPAQLAKAWLDAAGARCEALYGVEIASIRQIAGHWVVFDQAGLEIATAPNLVLANAGDAQRLLDGLAGRPTDWPLERIRGQTSQLATDVAAIAPALPLTGAGYLLPAIDGQLVFGATAQVDDDCAEVRAIDHLQNAERLVGLSPALASLAATPQSRFTGRTAWRCVAGDRLPLIGAVPQAWSGGAAGAWDQARFVPRQRGLYLFNALGSRGITWAPLGARVLASLMTGAPIPLEAGLLDAIDPARFLSRANRKKAAASPAGGAGSSGNG